MAEEGQICQAFCKEVLSCPPSLSIKGLLGIYVPLTTPEWWHSPSHPPRHASCSPTTGHDRDRVHTCNSHLEHVRHPNTSTQHQTMAPLFQLRQAWPRARWRGSPWWHAWKVPHKVETNGQSLQRGLTKRSSLRTLKWWWQPSGPTVRPARGSSSKRGNLTSVVWQMTWDKTSWTKDMRSGGLDQLERAQGSQLHCADLPEGHPLLLCGITNWVHPTLHSLEPLPQWGSCTFCPWCGKDGAKWGHGCQPEKHALSFGLSMCPMCGFPLDQHRCHEATYNLCMSITTSKDNDWERRNVRMMMMATRMMSTYSMSLNGLLSSATPTSNSNLSTMSAFMPRPAFLATPLWQPLPPDSTHPMTSIHSVFNVERIISSLPACSVLCLNEIIFKH